VKCTLSIRLISPTGRFLNHYFQHATTWKNYQKIKPAQQTMCGLWAIFYLAQKVGERVGKRKILLSTLSFNEKRGSMTRSIAKEKSNHLNTKYRKLRLILGDHLNASHSWFKDNKLEQSETLYLIAELHQESHYVKHHEQKILAFFAAMEAFAGALNKAGFHVLHLTLDETQSGTTLSDLLEVVIAQFEVSCFEYIEPDEYRLVNQLGEISNLLNKININTRCFDAEHFLITQSEIPHYFSADKKQRMETFYRKMRKRYQLLMDGESPEGGKWNYDADNRKKLLNSRITNAFSF